MLPAISIKMTQRDSLMFNFIKEALMDEKYPNLKWINRDERTINLYCPLKSKNYWRPLYEQIFDDYAKLKPRKSSDNRQRFLQAMKASPFVNLLKNKSSNENKYYQFWEHGRSSADEIDAIIAEEVGEIEIDDLQSIQLPNTSKSGPATGGAILGNNGNDLGNFSSPLPVDTFDSNDEVPIAFNYNEEIHNDIRELLSRVNNLEDNVLVNEANCLNQVLAGSNNSLPAIFGNDDVISRSSEQEITSCSENYMVPDIAEGNPESSENTASTSLFDPKFLLRDTVSCNEVINISNPYSLGEEESSYSFVTPDYDPEKELIQSCVIPANIEINSSPAIPKADFDQINSVQMMPSTSEESSKCEVAGVFRLNDNDYIVRHLQQNSASMGDNREKRYFMMVLKPGKM